MVSKEQKKLNRVINFVKKGLNSLADELDDVVKSINDFTKSLQKAQKDLKDVTEVDDVQTVSTSSKKVAGATPVQAKSAAANTLFSLLSHGEESGATEAPAEAPAATPAAPAAAAGPPSAPGGGGPPKPPGGAPTHVKRPASPGGAPAVAPQTGGGLGSLRDEMLDELTRLKKIMRGES